MIVETGGRSHFWVWPIEESDAIAGCRRLTTVDGYDLIGRGVNPGGRWERGGSEVTQRYSAGDGAERSARGSGFNTERSVFGKEPGPSIRIDRVYAVTVLVQHFPYSFSIFEVHEDIVAALAPPGATPAPPAWKITV
jgi:hypothetical protein